MKEELVSFETAKLAKEVGFNQPRDEVYEPDFICTAPTQSLLQRWLREEHNIHFWVYPKKVKKGQVCFDFIFIDAENPFVPTHFYKTYEEALEEGLKEALIIIKENE